MYVGKKLGLLVFPYMHEVTMPQRCAVQPPGGTLPHQIHDCFLFFYTCYTKLISQLKPFLLQYIEITLKLSMICNCMILILAIL